MWFYNALRLAFLLKFLRRLYLKRIYFVGLVFPPLVWMSSVICMNVFETLFLAVVGSWAVVDMWSSRCGLPSPVWSGCDLM